MEQADLLAVQELMFPNLPWPCKDCDSTNPGGRTACVRSADLDHKSPATFALFFSPSMHSRKDSTLTTGATNNGRRQGYGSGTAMIARNTMYGATTARLAAAETTSVRVRKHSHALVHLNTHTRTHTKKNTHTQTAVGFASSARARTTPTMINAQIATPRCARITSDVP